MAMSKRVLLARRERGSSWMSGVPKLMGGAFQSVVHPRELPFALHISVSHVPLPWEKTKVQALLPLSVFAFQHTRGTARVKHILISKVSYTELILSLTCLSFQDCYLLHSFKFKTLEE